MWPADAPRLAHVRGTTLGRDVVPDVWSTSAVSSGADRPAGPPPPAAGGVRIARSKRPAGAPSGTTSSATPMPRPRATPTASGAMSGAVTSSRAPRSSRKKRNSPAR